jgi:hypothetical protein
MHTKLRLENLKGRDQLEDLDVDGDYIKEIIWEGVDWIDMVQDKNLWQALVNTVMNFGFHKRQGIS